MAIIIEEPKPPKDWGTIIGIFLVVSIIFSGVYFLFFKKPVLIGMIIPISIQETEKLSKMIFDPTSIQNNAIFQSLRQYNVPAATGQSGRTNPFTPY